MNETHFKYHFRVIIQEKFMKQACELMRKIDLDIGEVGVSQNFTFSSKKDLSISTVKDLLTSAIEACDMTVLHIEGGKVE